MRGMPERHGQDAQPSAGLGEARRIAIKTVPVKDDARYVYRCETTRCPQYHVECVIEATELRRYYGEADNA